MPELALMSIKPKYAYKILTGEKKYEFRRRKPSFYPDTIIVVYATLPEGKFIGHFTINKILSEEIHKLWEIVEGEAGISYQEYLSYFGNHKVAYALEVGRVFSWRQPVALKKAQEIDPSFNPPQSYHYLYPYHPLQPLLDESIAQCVF